MAKTTVAVTGASGFVGRHVLHALEGQDLDIVAVTRNAAHLPATAPGISVVEMDLATADAASFERLHRPDILIHLAWDGLPNYRSAQHVETELPRQLKFLRMMTDAGLNSLLVTGTCFEYGMQSGCLAESMATRPDNPYGLAKDRLRRELEAWQAEQAFALTWARLFYMYGADQPASTLYQQLRRAVARGERVFNMSGGEQLRDYLPVERVAELLVILATQRLDAGCVNICSGEPISVRQLVEDWLASNDWSIALNLGHYPYPDYEPMEFWGDRTKLDRILRGEV